MQGSIAAQNQLAAELATLQNVHQSTMAQLEQVHAEYATLKEELEVAQAAQASAEADAAAQAQAAASAAESAEQFQQKAAAASQELQAALAKIEALKVSDLEHSRVSQSPVHQPDCSEHCSNTISSNACCAD